MTMKMIRETWWSLAMEGKIGDKLQPDPEYTGLLPVPPLLVGCAGDDEEKELIEEPPREGEERFSFLEDDTKYREAERCARLMCQ